MSRYYTRRGLAQAAEDTGSTKLAELVGPERSRALTVGYRVGSSVSVPLLVYHGYKRNESVGWAIVWGLVGGGFWVIGLPLAFAQGFAKRKVRSNVRRRRTSRRKR